MVERVAETIYRYSMFPSPGRVGVAVSGGADSVALLRVLHELAPRLGVNLTVLHFNHRLRGDESDRDAAFVGELAAEIGLPHVGDEADVARIAADSGDNLEQAARRARYRFFRNLLKQNRLDRIALGHTRSDQAETVLFRLLRGAGTTGLAAIRPVTSEGFVRPLIEVSRSEIESWLRERGFEWREDSTNHDLRFDRNRIRHQLLPELAGEWNPAIEETLARMAVVAGDEEEYWQGEMERLSDGTLRTTGDAVLADCARLGVLPRAVRRRLIRRAIELAKGDLRGIGQGHVERILELAAAGRGEGRIEAPGVVAERSFGTIRLAPPARWSAGIAYRVPLEPPARQAVPDSNSMICLEFAAKPGDAGYNTKRAAELDWDRIRGPIELRNWQPGDRFHPVGRDRPRKLKELFQEHRVPSWYRPGWPILVDKDQIIVWARTFGVAAHCVSGSQCHRVLRVWEEQIPQR